MADESGYQRQIRPQATEAMPLASAASFGAELGAKIEQVGEQLHRSEIAAYQQERRHTAAEEWSGFQRAFGMARDNMDGINRELRSQGGAGHAQRVRDTYEVHRAGLLDNITDRGVRQRAEAMFDDFGGNLYRREAEFEDVKRIENTLADWSEAERISQNRTARIETVEEYLAEQQLGHAAIEGLDLPDDIARKTLEDYNKGQALAFMRGQAERNPAEARALMASGLFDDVLDPAQVAALDNTAAAELRAREVAEQRRVAEARAASVAKIRADIAAQGNGNPLTDEQWAAYEADPAVQGDPGLLENVRQARSEAGFVRIYQGENAPPPNIWEDRIRQLAGRANRSDAENRELAWLQDNAPSAQAAFDRDPAGYLQRQGDAPALVWGDRASGAQAQAWREAQILATGRFVPPISVAQAAPVKDLYEQGQQIEALAMLDTFTDPFARVDAAQVVAGDDALFHRMAAMPPQLRQQVRSGTAAMRANPDLMRTEEFDAAGRVRQQHRRALTSSLQNIEVEDAQAIWASAEALTADQLQRAGTTLAEVDEERAERIFRANVTVALGGRFVRQSDGRRVQHGGLGTYQGGHAFILADDLSQAQWVERVNADVARQRDAGTGPVNPDGSPARLNAPGVRPVWIGGSFYEWRSSGGAVLKDRAGNPYISNVARRRR